MTRASVVVVSWNGEPYLQSCLASLSGELTPDDELIVVDNGSTDGTAALVRLRHPHAMLIENGCNLGFAGGTNVGMRAARGDALVLVNQDVAVQKGWLAALLDSLEPADTGIVGCKLLYPDGRLQHAGGLLRYPSAHPDHFGHRQADDGRWDEPRDVEYVMGAAMAIKRRVLERVGYLDEGFFPAYYEDVDLCARARAAGFRVIYAPAAVATHVQTTTVSRSSCEYHRWMNRGRLRFVLKHFTPEQFFCEFVPAERQWLASVAEPTLRRSLQLAYLDALLSLMTLPKGGVVTDGDGSQPVAEALIGLRAALSCVPGAALGWTAPDAGPSWSYRFRSEVSRLPILGGIAAALRKVWNTVAVGNLLRPLLLKDELDCLAETAVRLDREAADSHRVVAQSLYALQAELSALEARVESLERASR